MGDRVTLPPESALPWLEAFEQLVAWQKDKKQWTYSDLVYVAVRLLAEDPELLVEKRSVVDAILIDEYQDLNAAQHALVTLLCGGNDHVYCVGDDDQMIYGWRGAQVEAILRFEKQHAGAETATLSTNYRSLRKIVLHSGFLIAGNRLRVSKKLRAKRDAAPGRVSLCIERDESAECAQVVEFLKREHDKGTRWDGLSVLCRYREHFVPVADVLAEAGIPFTCDRPTLFGSTGAKTLVSYLRCVLEWPTPRRDAWSSVINHPNRYVKKEDVTRICEADDPVAFMRKEFPDKLVALVNKLEVSATRQTTAKLNTAEILERIDNEFGVSSYFRDRIPPSEYNDRAGHSLAIELIKVAARSNPDPNAFLRYCDSRADQEAQVSKDRGAPQKGVLIDTIHRAKGKEWQGVVLFHQEWRHAARTSEQARRARDEEERRVAYVGVTRAREALLVTCTRERMGPFVRELFTDPALKLETSELTQELCAVRETSDLLRTEREHLDRQATLHEQIMSRADGLDIAALQGGLDRVYEQTRGLRLFFHRFGFRKPELARAERALSHAAKLCQAAADSLKAVAPMNERIEAISRDLGGKGSRIEALEMAQNWREFLNTGIGFREA